MQTVEMRFVLFYLTDEEKDVIEYCKILNI